MKNRKALFSAIFALVLILSVVTVSAAAAPANGARSGKPATEPAVSVCDVSGDCDGQPLESFVKGSGFLTEEEKAALLADLAEIESLEAQIDELYHRMTDENAERLFGEIDALCEKLDSVLDRNAELWDRVDAEYDEKVAANEPDMTLEWNEDDFALCERSR